MLNIEQVARDLTVAYINNRYGPEVSGEFGVDYTTNFDSGSLDGVTGEGSVETERLPDLDDRVMARIPTGERNFFGLGSRKMVEVPTDEYAVDSVFEAMIEDYYGAYERILQLLRHREGWT